MTRPYEQQTLTGTAVELHREAQVLRATGRLVGAYEPRQLADGRYKVVVLLERRTRAERPVAVVAAAVPTALLMLFAIGWVLFLQTASLLYAAAPVAAAITLTAVAWWLLGRAGKCPGLHCPGCRCGGGR